MTGFFGRVWVVLEEAVKFVAGAMVAAEVEMMMEGEWEDSPAKISSPLLIQVSDPAVLTERILRWRQVRQQIEHKSGESMVGSLHRGNGDGE